MGKSGAATNYISSFYLVIYPQSFILSKYNSTHFLIFNTTAHPTPSAMPTHTAFPLLLPFLQGLPPVPCITAAKGPNARSLMQRPFYKGKGNRRPVKAANFDNYICIYIFKILYLLTKNKANQMSHLSKKHRLK